MRDRRRASFAAAPAVEGRETSRIPHRRLADAFLDAAVMTSAPLAIGLTLDRWFGFLPALTAECGGSSGFWIVLIWHWSCMPATLLSMALSGPISIAAAAASHLSGSRGESRETLRDVAAPALARQLAMIVGMASATGLGPRVAALAGLPWTTGALVAAMALGMGLGSAAAALRSPCGGGTGRVPRAGGPTY